MPAPRKIACASTTTRDRSDCEPCGNQQRIKGRHAPRGLVCVQSQSDGWDEHGVCYLSRVAPAEIKRCPCCLGRRFEHRPVLWPELVGQWGLNDAEAAAIDRQQGLRCVRCGASLRAMALASAVMRASRSRLWPFAVWTLLGREKVLEINGAAELHSYLKFRRSATRCAFPEVDMQALPFPDRHFDLVVHSDTLEHVPNPLQGLRECKRVLKPGGALVFTIPIISGRMSKRRDDAPASYHGSEGNSEYLVVTEYGADFWTQPMEAGFREVRTLCVDYPSGLAIICER